MAKGTGEPTLSNAGRACQQEPVALPDPVAARELEKERSVEAARGTEVYIFDLCVMAQPGRAGTCLEALLAARCRFVLEQDGEPFPVIEGTRLCLRVEILEGSGHAVQAEVAQHAEGGVCQHDLRYLQWK